MIEEKIQKIKDFPIHIVDLEIAKNINEAVKVLNMEINFDLDTYGWIREEEIELKDLILALKNKHPKINSQ